MFVQTAIAERDEAADGIVPFSADLLEKRTAFPPP